MNNWNHARRLLCIRLDTIGDVLMTTPALRALKHAVPGRHLTLLTSPAGAEVARLVPELDDVIAYAAPWMKHTAPCSDSSADLDMIRLLDERAFDGAVIFAVFSQSPLPAALMCYLARIPLRLARCHENPYQLLTDWLPDPEPEESIRHEVRRQLDLVAVIGAEHPDERLALTVRPAAAERAAELLARGGVDLEKPWLVLHPGASASARRYSPEQYSEVVRLLVATRQLQVVLTGAREESELVAAIQRRARVRTFSLAGKLDLAALAAVIQLAPLIVTNNTGPAHIAAAVGTPVVVLYALTNPQHTPWQVPRRVLYHDVPCRFCFKSVCPEGHHNCLRLVSPDAVVRAVDELYGAKGAFVWQPNQRAAVTLN